MSVPLTRRIVLHHFNDFYVGGTSQGEHVLAKADASRERFDIIFRGDSAKAIDDKMIEIMDD